MDFAPMDIAPVDVMLLDTPMDVIPMIVTSVDVMPMESLQCTSLQWMSLQWQDTSAEGELTFCAHLSTLLWGVHLHGSSLRSVCRPRKHKPLCLHG